jgi:hypothetical protein
LDRTVYVGSRRKMLMAQITISSRIVQPTKATMAVMSRMEPLAWRASVRNATGELAAAGPRLDGPTGGGSAAPA